MSDIKRIRKNIASYYDPITMPGDYTFDHVKTLKRINRFIAQKFKNGDYDSQGFYKYFFDIITAPVDIWRKFIDLDTKDFIFDPESHAHEWDVFLYKKRFTQWLKESPFAEFINDTRDEIPVYGGSIGKQMKSGDWETVPIENAIFDTTVESIHDSMYFYERHRMSPAEVNDMDWDNKDKLLNRQTTEKEKGHYTIYECYDKQEDGNYKRRIYGNMRLIQYGSGFKQAPEADINSEGATFVDPVQLDEREVDELPYRECRAGKTLNGRWLPVGAVELLFDPQIAINEAENLERKALQYSSLQLWQTRDDSIGGENIFSSGVENGDVIRVNQEITKVDMADRNTANYNNTRNRWRQLVTENTHTQDVSRGVLPSRQPVGTSNIQLGQVQSFFDETLREAFGLYLKDIVQDDVIPYFEKDTRKEHTLTFSGLEDNIERVDKAITEAKVRKKVREVAMDTGFFPSQERVDEIRQQLRDKLQENDRRYIKVPKDFYKDAKFKMDIVVTGESVDTGAKNQTLQQALQILNNNPQILQNKTARNIFFKSLSLGGISPMELGLGDSQIDDTEVPQGGSMAQPQQPEPTGQRQRQPQVV